MAEEAIPHHVLVPKHTKISEEEKNALLERYNIQVRDLPKIPVSDAALAEMDVKPGDVIKIQRASPTAGEIIFYRGVSSE